MYGNCICVAVTIKLLPSSLSKETSEIRELGVGESSAEIRPEFKVEVGMQGSGMKYRKVGTQVVA